MSHDESMARKLDEVARLAGVSPRTVSNVVNNFEHVRPATRIRVQQAIEQLGYRPNISARRLRQGRTGVLGLAVPELSQPYFAELSELIERAAQERGYTVMAGQTGGSLAREIGILQDFNSHTVDGLILSPMSMSAADLRDNLPGVPVVLIGEQIFNEDFIDIAIDNVQAVRDLTEHLISTGRSRIAALGAFSSPGYRSASLRLDGYRAALEANGIAFDDSLVLYTDEYGREAGRAATARAMAAGVEMDAVVCFSDVLAMGALRAFATAGITVPDQVAVVGMDDIEESAFNVPSLTTISPNKDAIATNAVSQLIQLITDPESDTADIDCSYTLVVRESSTAASASTPQVRLGE